MAESLKIGVVAVRTGLTIDAIRFYEKEGLLKAPLRSEGGFRLFRESDIDDLKLIRNTQTLGFSLEEIRDLLFVRNGTTPPCADVRKLLEKKLVSVRQKISTLMSLENEIRAALRECKRTMVEDPNCPVLDTKRPRSVRKK